MSASTISAHDMRLEEEHEHLRDIVEAKIPQGRR
ncbi:MAG: hypothetical protein BWY02_01923 [bacterium ADurb.Bin157]|nr:MAG: hypothetical protein BWY02_01923 [bacterium ADurb.Bin157]